MKLRALCTGRPFRRPKSNKTEGDRQDAAVGPRWPRGPPGGAAGAVVLPPLACGEGSPPTGIPFPGGCSSGSRCMPAPLWPVLESNGSHRPCCVPAALLGLLLLPPPVLDRGHVVRQSSSLLTRRITASSSSSTCPVFVPQRLALVLASISRTCISLHRRRVTASIPPARGQPTRPSRRLRVRPLTSAVDEEASSAERVGACLLVDDDDQVFASARSVPVSEVSGAIALNRRAPLL